MFDCKEGEECAVRAAKILGNHFANTVIALDASDVVLVDDIRIRPEHVRILHNKDVKGYPVSQCPNSPVQTWAVRARFEHFARQSRSLVERVCQ